MGLDAQTAMADEDVDDLLTRHETGVLALARAGEPYSIPISYGYDVDHRRFYVRLVSTPESDKRTFLASSPDCKLVIYEEDDPIYSSVVVTGGLEVVDPDDLTPDRIAGYGSARRPLFEIWSEGKADLDIELYVIEPEDIAGRRIDLRAHQD